MIIKKGTTISNGIAIGKALIICRDKVSVKGYKIQDTAFEIEKLNSAVSHTSKLLDQMQLISKTYKELYDVYKLLLTDESFIGKAVSIIEEEQVNEDGNLGYTTNYQKKTAMTTPDNHEPAKASQSYSMDNGVPTGTDKPYGKNKGDNQPFDKNVTEGCDECDENACPTDGDEEQVEEGTNVGGFVQQNSTSKSHVPNSNGRKARNMSKGGEHTATSTPRYSEAQMESIKAKAKEIFNENKKIRMVLENVKSKLQQAALVNKNLGMILKLVTENSTTQEEKHNIIRRFNDEATDINKSEQLYESISKELKNVNRSSNVSNVMNGSALTENVNKKQINETKVYQSQDLLKSLNLMNRMSKY